MTGTDAEGKIRGEEERDKKILEDKNKIKTIFQKKEVNKKNAFLFHVLIFSFSTFF